MDTVNRQYVFDLSTVGAHRVDITASGWYFLEFKHAAAAQLVGYDRGAGSGGQKQTTFYLPAVDAAETVAPSVLVVVYLENGASVFAQSDSAGVAQVVFLESRQALRPFVSYKAATP